MASSRVGTITRACGVFCDTSMPARIGRANAAVLPGARLGLSDNVFALEHAGNGLALDGRGGFVAHRGQSLEQEIGKTQLLEAGYLRSSVTG